MGFWSGGGTAAGCSVYGELCSTKVFFLTHEASAWGHDTESEAILGVKLPIFVLFCTRESLTKVIDLLGRTICRKRRHLERARQDKKREGKAPSTQAGEFVREEMEHIRQGKHGARSTKQAIAIGLSKARRAGVELAPPEPGTTSESTRKQAKRELKSASTGAKKVSAKRSAATTKALKREGHAAASKKSLSVHAKKVAAKRKAAK